MKRILQSKIVFASLSIIIVLSLVSNIFIRPYSAPIVFATSNNSLGTNKLTPLSSIETNEWGSSNSKTPPTGEWEVVAADNVKQNYLGNGWATIWRKINNTPNFKVTANVKLAETGNSSLYPKYGVYGAYKDEDNYILGFLDVEFNSFATFAKVDGVDMPWKSAAIPDGINLKEDTVELKSIKIGDTVKFYVNQVCVETLKYDIGDAQPGLITEDVKAEYTNYTVDTAITEFDESKELPRLDNIFGQASNGTLPNGNWVFDNGLIKLTEFKAGWSNIFYGNTSLNNYQFSVDVKLDQMNSKADYPKYGVYAYYKDSDNYVVAMIDPKFNMLATFARINGKDQEWQGATLSDVNYSNFNNIKVIKQGDKVDFYVNNKFLQSRIFSLSDGQPGLIVEECKVSYKNYSMGKPEQSNSLWGPSYDGSVGVLGNWQDIAGGGIKQLDLTESMTAIFYNQEPKDNYKATINLKALEVGSSQFPKYGIYAGHNSGDSFVWAFIHPKENIISTYSKVNGADMGWDSAALPMNFDFTQDHQLKVIKIGSEFRFYIDGQYLLTRVADIGKAQFGLVTFDCAAQYGNPIFSEPAGFDENSQNVEVSEWGNSYDNKVSAVGKWDIISSNNLVLNNIENSGTVATNKIFNNKYEMIENYKFTASITNQGMGEWPYAKYGFYAAYEKPDSYIYTFIHPKEKFISVFAIENGVTTVNWETFAFPTGFDINSANELKVIKLDGKMRVYVNNYLITEFNTSIKTAQVGLISEDVKANFNNIKFEKATQFDKPTTDKPDEIPLWGNSCDGKISITGDWQFDNTKLSQTQLQEVINQAFYHQNDYKQNYKYSAKVKPLSLGVSPYSKFGFVAAYENSQNYVWTFIHPKEKFLSVVALVDNVPVVNWAIYNLPADFDYSAEHELKVIKIGGEFRIYVDSDRIAKFNADIGAAQVGAITESVMAQYDNYIYEDATDFDDVTPPPADTDWGNSHDGLGIASGDWQSDKNSASQNTLQEGTNQLFLNGTLMSDYKFSTKMKPLNLGASAYAKFGYIAAYEDSQNFAWVFIHPKEKFLSVYAVVDNAPAVNWQIFNLPGDFDYSAEHEMKVIKIGNEFRVYIDNERVAQFNADIGASQVGIMTDSVQASYTDLIWQSANKFEDFENFWGASNDGQIPVSGTWTFTNNSLTQTNSSSDGLLLNLHNKSFTGDYVYETTISGINADAAYSYPKAGVMLAYNSPSDYVYVFLHIKEGIYSLFHPSYSFFQVGNLPAGVDFNDKVSLKVERTGIKFKIYINDIFVFEFDRDMGEVQVGVVTEKTSATFENFKLIDNSITSALLRIPQVTAAIKKEENI